MKLTTRGRFGAAVLSWIGLSWIGALALLVMAPLAMAAPPVVEAGPDRTQPNVQPGNGEFLTLDVVSISDPDGNLLRYDWYLLPPSGSEFYVGSGPGLRIHTTDGVSRIRVVAIDTNEETAEDS